VLAKLPADVQAAYNAYASPIYKSLWSNWKPPGQPPYSVGLVLATPANSYSVTLNARLVADLKKDPQIGKVTVVTATSDTDIAGQLQQWNSLVQTKPTIMFLQALSPPTMLPAVKAAAKNGIPTINLSSALASPDSVDLTPNAKLEGLEEMAALARILHGKGDVLGVHSLPVLLQDQQAFAGYEQILRDCPGMKLAGTVDGEFVDATVKSAILQFLTTHPSAVSGVVEDAEMSDGVLEGFQGAGKSVPPIMQTGAQDGATAYWAQNLSKGYHAYGLTYGPVGLASEAAEVASRMLAGGGLKINTVIAGIGTLTDQNVKSYVQPGWTASTDGTVEGPTPSWLSSLSTLFNHPSKTSAQ
jgi:ribose transport system substrate-binding protein